MTRYISGAVKVSGAKIPGLTRIDLGLRVRATLGMIREVFFIEHWIPTNRHIQYMKLSFYITRNGTSRKTSMPLMP
jgi:hypothetical protein